QHHEPHVRTTDLKSSTRTRLRKYKEILDCKKPSHCLLSFHSICSHPLAPHLGWTQKQRVIVPDGWSKSTICLCQIREWSCYWPTVFESMPERNPAGLCELTDIRRPVWLSSKLPVCYSQSR